VLRLADEYDCEADLGQGLLNDARRGEFPSITAIQERYLSHHSATALIVNAPQHALSSYDALLSAVNHQTQEEIF
jgi:hypothetical protein